jgi:Ca2+-binding RTX toxin-like protein
VIDNIGDRIVEVGGGGHDQVKLNLASAASYQLENDVEDVQVLSAATVAVNVTGNALDNIIIGNAAANKLVGGAGADILDGGAGNDTLTGGSEADTFVLSSLVGSKTITDFVSGTDHVALDKSVLWPGAGSLNGSVQNAPGGFGADQELVLFTQKMATASAANAAAIIGSATSAYKVGDAALFAVSTATATTLYSFVSSGADADVSASELTALVTLTGAPSTVLADYYVV